MKTPEQTLQKRIRAWLIFFIVGLLLSGITAFPIETQLDVLIRYRHIMGEEAGAWLEKVWLAVKNTNQQYPFLSYGTDWLAFAHIVIATAFIGPLRHPVRNVWIIQFGMIACLMVLPLALIAGPIPGIPLFWQLIDCSFGLIGILPLYRCYVLIRRLEVLEKQSQLTN